MFCPDCGAENSRSQKFCTRCGTNLIAIDRAREIVSEMRANASAPPVSPGGILKIVALISAIGFIDTAAGTVALKHTGLTQSFFALVGFTALVMICRYLLQLIVSLIGIKPIIKCVSQRSCEHVETRPSLSGTGEKFFLDFSSLDKSPEFAYESTSFDYEFVSQPHDG